MKTRLTTTLLAQICIAGALSLATGAATAEEPASIGAFANLTNLEVDDLKGNSGRSGDTVITVQSNQNLEATITGSTFSVDEVNSGGVTFSEGALENFSGVGLFNVVTGNNNAVNSSVGVTVNLQ